MSLFSRYGRGKMHKEASMMAIAFVAAIGMLGCRAAPSVNAKGATAITTNLAGSYQLYILDSDGAESKVTPEMDLIGGPQQLDLGSDGAFLIRRTDGSTPEHRSDDRAGHWRTEGATLTLTHELVGGKSREQASAELKAGAGHLDDKALETILDTIFRAQEFEIRRDRALLEKDESAGRLSGRRRLFRPLP
jgi:hypothetical protein